VHEQTFPSYVKIYVNGGLAIYGKDFGRYQLDPTLVFVEK
jgi:hypothetical protein